MTLIAAQVVAGRIEILADGLSCHDRLSITRVRRIGATDVKADVPGRTTLQKIFPHPHIPFAIAHCGSNQHDGVPIGEFVERFWQRAVAQACSPESLPQMFEEEFDRGSTAETYLLLGWQAEGHPVVHVLGPDIEHLDGGRCWTGSGRDTLSRDWCDLNSLRESADRNLAKFQKKSPYKLPFFANCYGGHWHRLLLVPTESPQWMTAPRSPGIVVSSLLPGSSRQVSSENPGQAIREGGEKLKDAFCRTLNVKTARGFLQRIVDEELREQVARLVAIYDEVGLDQGIATAIDAGQHAAAVDDAVVRLVEREVLDQRHRQFALISRHETVAVESLLRCYSQVLRDLRTGRISKPSDEAKSQTANEGLRGLAHCLRWIKECCPSSIAVPTPPHDVLAQETLKLLQWGVAYDPVWNQHSAYSRGLVLVDTDEKDKVITFLPQQKVSPHYFCTQIEAKKADDERIESGRPDSDLAALSREWYDSVTASGNGLHFDDATIRETGAIDVAYSWMKRTCLPELEDSTSLMGCEVGELRLLLATLYVYSLFVTKLEDVSDEHPALDAVLRPRTVARRRDLMIDWLGELSGIPRGSVDAILSVITFDPTHPHVTLAQQPFVSTEDGQLFFAPRMLLFLDLPRMYVGALNKNRQGRAVYAQTINEIESVGVQAIANEIRGHAPDSLQIVSCCTFRLPNGCEITPDIVIVSEHDQTVLVIDVKYATPPFGPADIHRDVEEMGKWRARMVDYVTGFESNSEVLAQHLQWASTGNATVVGLVLTRWPFPIPVDVDDRIGAVDWPSLREHIQQVNSLSIGDLMSWAINRPDAAALTPLAWTTKDVQVDEWNYQYSVLTPLSGEHLLELTEELAYRLWEERGRPFWDDQRDWFDAERHLAANPYNPNE